ncbi:twin-arginine translocation signal domain-containing protein, partial [Adlercreutzia caecimuris]|uniref:twin-arginine translocation signal domain-containing protein n=2 Tax=Adlercreutzia caecimuris TaxID=671266 RepID=UPI0033077DD1
MVLSRRMFLKACGCAAGALGAGALVGCGSDGEAGSAAAGADGASPAAGVGVGPDGE